MLCAQASGIPAFFTAFCVNPFASNAMELISSIRFAMRRKKKNISLTNSQASTLLCYTMSRFPALQDMSCNERVCLQLASAGKRVGFQVETLAGSRL